MPDPLDESGKTYTVDPKYRKAWDTGTKIVLAAAAVLAVGGIIAAIAGQAGVAAVLITLAVISAPLTWLARAGMRVTSKHRYALTVRPDRMTVVWRDEVTHLPWGDLEYGVVVENGPAYRALEVKPVPGVRPVLPKSARPRPSKLRPSNIEVFILSFLGDEQADCVGDVARYLEIR